MIPALNSINPVDTTSSVNLSNVLENIQNNMKSSGIDNIANNIQTNYLHEFGSVLDNASDSYDFLNKVVQSSDATNIMSAQKLVNFQDKVAEFNISTQLVGKTVSIAIKDVDGLVRLQ